MILQRYADPVEAARALAEQVVAVLRTTLVQAPSASLAVPGGRTPVPLFRALREADLDWGRVDVTLTDERWVGEAHAESNAALVRRELLCERAASARFHPLYDGSASAESAVQAVWQSLAPLPRPFGAVVLGMGDDGHFASLFPGSPGLSAALDPAAAPACVVMRAPVDPVERISLNLSALLQTRRLFLFITGTRKRDLLLAATRRAQDSVVPAAALLSVRMPMPEVFWAP